jgi:predicted RNA-binding Zn-ribbon protein involved in translation (DUF1610 family)
MTDTITGFDCPDCGQERPIEEVIENAVAVSKIFRLSSEMVDYHPSVQIIYGDISHFQCAVCGAVIKDGDDPIKDTDHLFEYLKGVQDAVDL